MGLLLEGNQPFWEFVRLGRTFWACVLPCLVVVPGSSEAPWHPLHEQYRFHFMANTTSVGLLVLWGIVPCTRSRNCSKANPCSPRLPNQLGPTTRSTHMRTLGGEPFLADWRFIIYLDRVAEHIMWMDEIHFAPPNKKRK